MSAEPFAYRWSVRPGSSSLRGVWRGTGDTAWASKGHDGETGTGRVHHRAGGAAADGLYRHRRTGLTGEPVRPHHRPPAPSVRPTIAFQLYTHCGIDEARIGSAYFEAETPLSDGSAGPPEGWDNPYQSGRMTLTSATRAVFTDDAGHEVVFRARPGAKSFKVICE